MRLLFLDFDGVLHPQDAALPEERRFCWLSVLESLLVDHPDVRITVHSSWRYEYTNSELRALLGPLGQRFAGSAPRGPREQVIELVLQANRHVRHHLVIDDDPREFTGSAVNLLLVDPLLGISDEAAQAAIRVWLQSTASVHSSGAS